MTADEERKQIVAEVAEPGWIAQRVWVDRFKTGGLALALAVIALGVSFGWGFRGENTRSSANETRSIVNAQIAARSQCPRFKADSEKCQALLRRLFSQADDRTLRYIDRQIEMARRKTATRTAAVAPARQVAQAPKRTAPATKKVTKKKKAPVKKSSPPPAPAPTPPAPAPVVPDKPGNGPKKDKPKEKALLTLPVLTVPCFPALKINC